MLTLGIVLTATSAFYASSFLAILGVALIFWGAILLYITPAKHVPLTLLNAATISALGNIERTLSEADLSERGRYLPPSFLRDFESSVVFIPEWPEQPLPTPEEVAEEKQFPANRKLVLITPPGRSLCQLFEKELGISFTKTDLDFVQQKLPKLLVEDMELAETAELQIQNDTVTLELTGNVLKEICQETRNLPRTHSQVGCLLSSAVACVLAKASGKVVTIQEEELSEDRETTRIECRIEEAEPLLQSTTPEGLTQEQPLASLSPTPEIIVDKPMETMVTAQSANVTAPTFADHVAALDTNEKSNSEPAAPTMVQRQEYQEISVPKSILNALNTAQGTREMSTLKDTVNKLRGLEAEKLSLTLEIEELRKMADAKAAVSENEIAALREEVKSLKALIGQEEKPEQPSISELEKGSIQHSTRDLNLTRADRIQAHKIAPKLEEGRVAFDLESLNKTIDEQEKKIYGELAAVRQQIERLRQLTED